MHNTNGNLPLDISYSLNKKKMKQLICALLLFCSTGLRAQQADKDSIIKRRMIEAKGLLTGRFSSYNPRKAFEIYKECALKGNADAMNAVGMQYRFGLGVDTNYNDAFVWFKRASEAGNTKATYNLGIQYKYGIGCTQDFVAAFNCFKKAADANELAALYAEGYMLYKGLGCNQDYTAAFKLFKKGSHAGKSSCMYFLGLCYRNGYGVNVNADSSKLWLKMASRFGYSFATDELNSSEAENAQEAKRMLELVRSLQIKAKPQASLNKYIKVEPTAKASDIEGVYGGYMVQYDWSGQHVIKINTLNLQLNVDAITGGIRGMWVEDDTVEVQLEASLTRQGIVFKNTSYSRADHYSGMKPVQFNFEKASLEQVRKGDSAYLTGNVNLYAVQAKEPEKPYFIILNRLSKGSNDSLKVQFADYLNSKKLKVYPNPFSNILTLDFEITERCNVYTQVLTLDGRVIYTNSAKRLEAGVYSLPMELPVPAGTYIIKLNCGKESKSTIAVKQ